MFSVFSLFNFTALSVYLHHFIWIYESLKSKHGVLV